MTEFYDIYTTSSFNSKTNVFLTLFSYFYSNYQIE